jgi:hypothetical protein
MTGAARRIERAIATVALKPTTHVVIQGTRGRPRLRLAAASHPRPGHERACLMRRAGERGATSVCV